MTTRAALPHHGTSTTSASSATSIACNGTASVVAGERRRRRRHLAPALGVLLTISALAGCAGDEGAGGGGTGGTTIGSGSSARADRGWLGGSPDFHGASSDRAGDGARGVDAAVAESASAAPLSAPASTIAASTAQPSTALQAGSVDDNEDYAGFLSYLDRLEAAGIGARPWDPSGRILLQVDAGGRSVPGAKVTVRVAGSQAVLAELRTTADGTVRFLPAAYGDVAAAYTFEAGGTELTAPPGSSGVLTAAAAPGSRQQAPAVDVLFLLDTTGSMGDELSQLTANIATIADNVAAMAPDADLRVGMTLYRDDVDAFTTATYDFTGDIDAFGRALDEVTADGGGDTPEALDEGFAEALAKPSWRPAGEALQLIFVVGDAAPQVGRNVPTPYTESLREAMARGIKVFPIASSGTDDVAELVFRELAQATGGRFVFLAYGAAGAALGSGTDIATTDYEELSLDQLITRFIAEELTDWTGTAVTVPVPSSTSTTRPPNQ